MNYTRKRKKILAFILLGTLLVGELSSAANGVWKGRKVQAQEEGYLDVSGIPVTPGAIYANDTLMINETDVVENTTTSITLSWVCNTLTEGVYYIYRYNEETQIYEYAGSSRETTWVCTGLKAAKKYYFTICAYDEENGIQGAFSYPMEAYTKPKKVGDFSILENTANSMKMEWGAVAGAQGYIVYRAESTGDFAKVATTEDTMYTDTGLASGKTYRYKIRAYVFDEDNYGALSAVAKMTTLPAAPEITVKGGDKKARITWDAVTGANGYYLYWYDGTNYQYLATLEGKKNTEYLHTGLKNGEYSKYKVEAYRTLFETDYKSAASNAKQVKVAKQTTVTTPKLYKTKKKFKNSSAYKECTEFKKKVKYAKSYVIPGLAGTDVDGFYSKDMCPQGLTFAGAYLLLSAYDKTGEENSVIYVMNKSSRKLIMTIVLPNKTHAGGIAYDGTNIWVTQSKTVRSIPFADIQKAISANQKEYLANYHTICTLTHAASALTYYKNKLWVASYDELAAGYLGAYTIQNKSSNPTLTKCALTRIPTRVQGLTFTSAGKLILSRSCQTDPNKRGFLHVIDVYKPNLSKLSKGTITMGAVKKTVEMPTMNEEIAISGKYLYVNFESAAFSSAVKPMDRVCAFKTSAIVS